MRPRPVQPPARLISGGAGHNLLRRVLRVETNRPAVERIVLIESDQWSIALRDTGPDGTPAMDAGHDMAIHVLWALDDDAAALRINGRSLPIAPGDTITLPAGTVWSAAPGMILCEIEGPGASSADVVGPTHGDETFHGYNRQTTYPSPPGLTIERWKITQAFSLPDSTSPYVIVDLIDPLALVWSGGTDLIGRGECRLIPPGAGPISLLPNGLGYALIVRQQGEG